MSAPAKCSECWRAGKERTRCNCLLFEKLEVDMGVVCDSRNCTQQAVFVVRIHPIDHCTESDRFFLLCTNCTDVTSWRMGELIGKMYAQLPDSTEPVECQCDTCGKRIMDLGDVVTVERLIPHEF